MCKNSTFRDISRYETSTLRQAEIALASQTLSPKEAEVIFNTTQPGGDVVTVTSYSFIESQLFGDKFFAPTAKIMNSNSCGLEDRHYRQEGNYYWLSAAAKDDPKLAGYISTCGDHVLFLMCSLLFVILMFWTW